MNMENIAKGEGGSLSEVRKKSYSMLCEINECTGI